MALSGRDLGGRFAAVVGAPRCGTTSLSRYLGAHPDVDFSVLKEPHFFSQFDLTGLDPENQRKRIEEEYIARYFADASGERMLMEGSVTYLYAPDQMKPILRVWPNAKFIISVRDPLAMLPSLHQRLLFMGDETEPDFAKAWALAPERALGRHVPRTCVEAKWLLYPEIGRLGKYVEQFLDAVGPERCLVIVFDDLAKDPGAVYRRVLDFLDLPDDHRIEFSPERSSRAFRIGWLQRLLKRPPRRVRTVIGGEKFRLHFKKLEKTKSETWFTGTILSLRKSLLTWNEAPAPKTQLPAELQAELRDLYAEDIVRLAHLLGRDLSHWLGGVPEAKPPAERRPAAVVA